jgi:hypothetical protein
MKEPRVFDHTALIALFDGNDLAFQLWWEADRGAANLVLPATAVTEGTMCRAATRSSVYPSPRSGG